MSPTTTLLDELKWRGLLFDATPGMAQRLAKGPITGYVGFDPTATSLQVGNLVPVMLLAHLQRAGGKPIVLMGGGTGMIGDPSGKRTERPLMSVADIDANVARQQAQFERFFSFGRGKTDAVLLDNAAWLRPLKLVAFLRDIGKHFTLSYMLQKESVKARMDEGISYTEFSYMLLQAYDFLHLYRAEHCELQMGGSDQWGNITAGTELIRRVEGGEAHCICAPLITTATGVKFGKSEGESVWLDQALTPPVRFYNFWVNTDDRDVEKYLKMFTFKSAEEITALMAQHRQNPGERVPHHALAFDVTSRVHGEATARELKEALHSIHGDGGAEDIVTTISRLLGTVADVSYQWDAAHPPKTEDLFVAAGLASSKSDARRLMGGKGLKLNGEVVAAGETVDAEQAHFVDGRRFVLLQKGKKTFQPLHIVGL